MKIVFDAFWWTEGPISNRSVMQEVILAWLREFPGDEIGLIVAPGAASQVCEELQLDATNVRSTRIGQHGLAALFEYRTLARSMGADHLLTHNFAPVFGRNISTFVHDFIFVTNPEWFTRAERIYFQLLRSSLRSASWLFTSSNTEAERIGRFCEGLADVTPTGISISAELAEAIPAHPGLKLKPYEFTLMVGRLNERKNLGFGLEALAKAGALTPDNPVIVVGEEQGKSASFSAEIDGLVRQGSIQFIGHVTSEVLAWLYTYSSLVVFPTHDEGFGLPVVEARHFGAPLALSDIAILREVAGDADATFFPPDDLERAALLLKQTRRRNNSERDTASKVSVSSQYSWSSTVRTMRSALTGSSADFRPSEDFLASERQQIRGKLTTELRLGVVIPAFNAGHTLEASIRSAFEAGAVEVVVVDDGSSDNTSAVASEAGARVVWQENAGAAAARRHGLQVLSQNCTAVVFLDSDDFLIPSGIEKALAIVGSQKVAAVCGRTVGLHGDGTETTMKDWSVEITTETLLERGYGPCPPASVVWDASALRGAMSDEIPALWPRYAEDYELLVRGSINGKIASSGVPASRYQMTGGKSAASTISSVRDAERIRLHYAELSGINISPRGASAQSSLALIRNASGERRRSVMRYAYLFRALFAHPPTLVSFAVQSLEQKR